MTYRDTIFALSSGPLPSGVAVVRLSGPHVRFVLETMIGSCPEPRKAWYGAIRGTGGLVLDQGICLFFEGPASFTGEDCAEFQLHGGRAVVDAVLFSLSGFEGVRAAEAGEFTRRAFLNGKLDLTQAEGLSDLISAETEMQRRMAITGAAGSQAGLYRGWRDRLVHMRAMIEAELDFSDEEDVPGSVSGAVWQEARALVTEIKAHMDGFQRSEIIRDGFRVVLVGAPNAGKSSLLNALARREAAIVTDEPGTTRDPIEVVMDLDGFQVKLVDTAGIRDPGGKVEKLGIERTFQKLSDAHLILNLVDLSDPVEVRDIPKAAAMLRVGTKSDLLADRREPEPPGYDHVISVIDGQGVDVLLECLADQARSRIGEIGTIMPSRRRHIDLLEMARGHIEKSAEMTGLDLELRAEELRMAGDAIGRISGTIDVEDLLDVIFSQFCIGK